MLRLDSGELNPEELIPGTDQIDLSELPLTALFAYYGASCKSTAYKLFYSELDLSLNQNDPFTILEIGTASGASARALATRFQRSHVYTLDVNPLCQSIFSRHSNITPITCDTASIHDIKSALDKIPSYIDIVIDDGSHMSKDVIACFECMLPRLSGSYHYIIEDCDSIGNGGYSQYMKDLRQRSLGKP